MNDATGRDALSRAERDREVVQRTAELLTSSLPLEKLFHAVCSLLARFVDASMVFIALKDAEGGRVAYTLENGEVGTPENRRVRPESRTAEVLRSGRPALSRSEQWNGVPVSAIFVPLKFGAEVIGVLSVQSTHADAYDEEDVALLQTCALYLSVRIHQAQIESMSARLENMASTDSLTGIANRRSFNQRFAAEWRRSVRRGTCIALMLIDIDFFKAFNDTYGHVAGDAALQQVANALSSCLGRSEDLFARYGGEEFVAILPGTDLSGALKIAERMRQAAYDLGIAHSGSLLHSLTISAGVACTIPTRGSLPEALVEAADAALYQAKRGGRNRVAAENYRSDTPPAYPSKSYRHNLPDMFGRSFGRAEHLLQVRKLLRTARLLTIAGPAGIGKSREAVEAARREIGRFPDGVFYVDCSTMTHERYLANKVASVVGAPESALVTAGLALSEFLHGKRALIVLDNCTRVAAAAANFLRTLMAHAREVKVVVTNREPLLVPGEVSFVLPPLGHDDAVRLFLERAAAVRQLAMSTREKAVVNDVCGRLGGSPRAIELAAAQLRTFDLEELAARLPDRAQLDREMMRGFVQWSCTVLPQEEQRLLRHLSVFVGGAQREAIVEVCGGEDLLQTLVEKALVTVESSPYGPRYALPEAVRSYGAQECRRRGEWRDLSLRHARHYRERARELEAAFSTTQWRKMLEKMLAEIDNVRAALIFTVSQGNDVQLGAELSCDLVNYWQQLGHKAAGHEWMQELLARGDGTFPTLLRAKILCGVARLDAARSKGALDAALLSIELYRQLGDERGLAAALFEAAAACSGLGDIDGAVPHFDEAYAIAERIGDVRRMADVLNGKALGESWRGRPDNARTLFERSLELFQQLEDDRGIASVLGNLGDLAATVGDYDRAVALSRQSLAILERLHDAQSTGWQLLNLGAFELKRGNMDAARPALRRALEVVREYQDEWLSANCVDCLSRLALAEKDWTRALRLAGFADTVLEAIGVPRQPPDQLDYENVLLEARTAVGPDAARKEMETARTMSWSDAVKESFSV